MSAKVIDNVFSAWREAEKALETAKAADDGSSNAAENVRRLERFERQLYSLLHEAEELVS